MKTQLLHAAAALASALFLGGCHRDHVPVALESCPVRSHEVRAHDLPVEVVASGAIEAIDKADVAFMVSGRVLTIDVEDGALVRKGQLLARIDPSDYEKGVVIAEAQLAEVQARHARLSRLHETGSLTDTDFEKIDAALKEATAAAELARRQLGYAELHAPFDGWVVKRGVAAGTVVGQGMPVFTVLSPGPVWANLGVSETGIAAVKPGLPVSVRGPALGTESHEGKVDAILPDAHPLTRAFTVKVRLDNRDGALRHGNVVVGRILTGENRRALSVPPQVVQKNPDGSLFVWLIDPTRQVAMRQIIEVGALRGTEVEIVAGLKEGDRIIRNVPHTLFEGAHLTVAK